MFWRGTADDDFQADHAEPGRPPGELVLPPQDVEPVLNELLSPLWINFQQDLTPKSAWLQLYAHVHTPDLYMLMQSRTGDARMHRKALRCGNIFQLDSSPRPK